MQSTTIKSDQPLPLLDVIPAPEQITSDEKNEERQTPPPPQQDLHAFVASMWNVASPTKSKATSVGSEQELQWQEHQLKAKDDELIRRKEELLEAKKVNKSLGRQHRRDKRELTRAAREIEELHRSNTSLWEELEDVLSINRILNLQERDLQLKAAKLSQEKMELRRINANLRKELGATKVTQKLPVVLYHNKEEPGQSVQPCGILRPKPARAKAVTWQEAIDEMDYGSEAASCYDDSSYGTFRSSSPLLPEIVDLVNSCLSGTVSRWVKGMQTACDPDTVEALVLPWLMHKLFDLTSEVVMNRCEELAHLFVERKAKAIENFADHEDADATAESAHTHLHQNDFIMSVMAGDKLKATIDSIMISLAHSITQRKGWDPSVQAPEAIHGALAKSGLEQIAREYLHIMLYCCLHKPEVTFSNDLGKMKLYNPDLHEEPIDGEPPGGFCVVIFPALIVTPNGEDDGFGEQHVISRRFVMGKGEGQVVGRDRRVCFADAEL